MTASAFVLYTLLLIVMCNVLGLIISLLPYHSKFFFSLRIQQDKKISVKDFYRRLPLIGLNVFLMATLSGVVLYFMFPFFEFSLELDLVIILLQVFIILFVDDFFFYGLHRWLHTNKTLLKKVHSIHHRANAPIALDYLYVHPLEWSLGYIGPFIGIVGIALVGPISIWGFWIYLLIRNLHELDVHSGFRSFLSPWIPFWGEGEHHDLHHRKPNCNYASTFTLWDTIFKTKSKLSLGL
jgi:sterol desaturase/sphingolipid hydroxylase (fatty acid hydroxylase superfamily)